jgi:drug/metabolite transporter (DMT)-like permease
MDSPNGSLAPGCPLPPSAGFPYAQYARLQRRAAALSPTAKGLLWAAAAGLVFSQLNALMRLLTLQLDAFQTQFLRYLFGLLVILPLVLRSGLRAYLPTRIGPQFTRGAVHTVGLCLWFIALPKIGLADMTAIGFTGPIFIMIGAYLFFGEAMRWERWLAAAIGLAGVLVVLAPKLSGQGGVYNLVMLASAPVFAASFLLTKGLTRHESTGVIVVWQAISVTLFSLPLALWHWQAPSIVQWCGFAVCGLLGSGGHYCLTRSFRAADISSTQSVKFLDLIWATLMGWLLFGDAPTQSTLIGGTVICAATLWIARRESRLRPAPVDAV